MGEWSRHYRLFHVRQVMLSTADVAVLAGVKPETVRQYIARGVFPPPDGYFSTSPWWYRETVDVWLQGRRLPGRPKTIKEEK